MEKIKYFETNQKLKKIEKTIFDYKNLEELNLSNNEIHEIPEDIEKLEKLRILNLSGNKIVRLPPSIGKLKNLVELNISYNHLIELPDTIKDLKNLKNLHLSGMMLQNIPEEFGELVNLENLSINPPYIPKSIGNLKKLKTLYLSSENLKDIPSEFGNLISLESLFMNFTNIEKLPGTFGNLKALKILDLSNNKNLSMIPESIVNLTSLVELNLSYCRIEKIPETLGNLSSLKKLSVSLGELPKTIGDLTDLEILNIEGPLNSFNPSFFNLKNLKSLNITHTNINMIPDDIKKLSNLTELFIHSNMKLKSIADSITDIKTLKKIFLSSNENLKELPENFEALQSLEEIEFLYCVFDKIPETFSRLKSLKKIRLALNKNLTNFPFTLEQLRNLSYLELEENPNILLPIYMNEVPENILTNTTKQLIRKNKMNNFITEPDLEKELLKELDASFKESIFPYSDDFGTGHSVTGLMRLSGFKGKQGACLVFELVEYNAGIGAIETRPICISTFSVNTRPSKINNFYIELNDFKLESNEEFDFNTNNSQVKIKIDEKFIGEVNSYHNESGAKPIDEAILLFKICETLPKDCLFMAPNYIKEIFQIPASIQFIFSLEKWRHPTIDELFGDDIQPSEFISLKEIVNALCNGTYPVLSEKPNTDWRKVWTKR